MGLKLNSIDDASVADDLAYQQKELAEMDAEPRPTVPAAASRYDHGRASYCEDIGLAHYQQQSDSSLIKSFLKRAADLFISEVSQRGSPQPEEHRSSWEMERYISLTVCFSNETTRSRAASVQRNQYHWPELDFPDPVVQYVECLQSYLRKQSLLPSDCEQVMSRIAEMPSRAELRQMKIDLERFIFPAAKALIALVENNPADLNNALRKWLDGHIALVKKGDLRRSYHGFIALPALLFAKLGSEKNMIIDVDSPYLPLHLII